MGSEQVNQMFQKHLLEEGHLHYGEFMNDLSRLIVSFFYRKNFIGEAEGRGTFAWYINFHFVRNNAKDDLNDGLCILLLMKGKLR